ncbi:response regulator [Piscinibacter sp. XHJ-5]|uniref:response regulator transcription factor n=1 Tax=Piscinibacter sp. XHJ-5 TaxID=3037797 RepID=UPI00245323D5|nr:response regulator [Piscinibacter sp. XHJ-5]
MPKPQLARPLVCVVDDDSSVRESLPPLLMQVGYAVRVFASAEEFLTFDGIAGIACLVLDVAMPGLSGPQLQLELARRGHAIPVVFITARAEDDVRQRLLAQGAVECLFKPFTDTALLKALALALGGH